MPKFIDRTGEMFGQLQVVRLISKASKLTKTKTIWECLCSCGDVSQYPASNLVTKTSTRCVNCRIEKQVKHGKARRGLESSEYISWLHLIQRCTNENNTYYKEYGGRGITVCEEWLESFENFLEDMGECPDKFTIDRVDVNKGYYKENCRWASRSTQSFNKRKSGEEGVYFRKDTNKWTAYINKEGERFSLGCYDTKEEALKVRQEKEKLLYPTGELNYE